MLCGLLGFLGFLPGYACRLLALIARLALGTRLNEAALLGGLCGGNRGSQRNGK